MALTYQDFTVASSVGGGGTLPLSVTLEAVSSAHLAATLDGAAFTSFTVSGTSGAYTVTCSGPLTAGSVIRVYRSTPATKAGRVVTYADGAALDQDALNTSYLQLLYIFQELQEDGLREHPFAMVPVTPGSAVLATASATWDSDAGTKVGLDAITDSLNNTGNDIVCDATNDRFTLSAGKWKVAIEIFWKNNDTSTPYGATAALRDETNSISYKINNTNDPATGYMLDRRGTNTFATAAYTKTFILSLAAATTFSVHAAAGSTASTDVTIGSCNVLCERVGD